MIHDRVVAHTHTINFRGKLMGRLRYGQRSTTKYMQNIDDP